MSRRFGSILAMFAAVLICVSCGKERPLAPRVESVLTHPVFAQNVDDPGEFHNAIVRAYAHQRPFGRTALLPRREFIHAMVAGANQAFADRGLPTIVTEPDIEFVLTELYRLKRSGVFDIFSGADQDVGRILETWEATGLVSHEDARAIRLQIAAYRSGDSGHVAASRDQVSVAQWIVGDVYKASKALWGERDLEPELAEAGTASNSLSRESVGIELDAIGAILGLLGGPVGSILVGAAFSVLYYEVPPAEDWGWDCSDYCNMG